MNGNDKEEILAGINELDNKLEYKFVTTGLYYKVEAKYEYDMIKQIIVTQKNN